MYRFAAWNLDFYNTEDVRYVISCQGAGPIFMALLLFHYNANLRYIK